MTTDVDRSPDGVHFTREGADVWGGRLAKAALRRPVWLLAAVVIVGGWLLWRKR